MKIRFFLFSIMLVFSSARAQQTGNYFEWGRQMEMIAGVMEQVLNNYVEEPNPEKMGADAIKGMLRRTDKYTRFYDEQQMFDQRLRQSGKVSGIGVRIRANDQGLQIRDVLPDTPARQAGLMPGDVIVEIDGTSLQDLSARQKDKLIKGKPGTEVRLKIRRDDKTFETLIRRRILEQDAVPYFGMLDGETGYIRLRKFTRSASREVQDALVELKNKGAKRIVLDLRNNPGGLLSQAINTVNLFIPSGKLVVETKSRLQKYNKKYFTKKSPVDEEIPLVVIVNRGSASASEIVSGTLQDYDRARIIGDTTYGKGLVQRFFPVKYGTYVKITISRYYLPSGRLIQKRDYWHRDAQGNITAYKRDTTAFYTEKGRKVYEHGGIAPDVYIPSDTLWPVVKHFINQDHVFDFFVHYIRTYERPASPEALDERALAEAFIRYARDHDMEAGAPWLQKMESAFQKVRTQIKNEETLKGLENELQMAHARLQNQLKSPGVKSQLGIEIKKMLLQYYFGDKVTEAYLIRHSPVRKYILKK
ncbi:MAG: S41 family peptidase [Chlorobi bacterium]|nr:S41 family peptidase [Chlorobiota bacterium]